MLVLAAFQGLINAFDVPARQAFVVEMVEDRQDLPNAIALNSSMVNAARLLGPSVAGALIAAFGEGWCFAIDAGVRPGAAPLHSPGDSHAAGRARARARAAGGDRGAHARPHLARGGGDREGARGQLARAREGAARVPARPPAPRLARGARGAARRGQGGLRGSRALARGVPGGDGAGAPPPLARGALGARARAAHPGRARRGGEAREGRGAVDEGARGARGAAARALRRGAERGGQARGGAAVVARVGPRASSRTWRASSATPRHCRPCAPRAEARPPASGPGCSDGAGTSRRRELHGRLGVSSGHPLWRNPTCDVLPLPSAWPRSSRWRPRPPRPPPRAMAQSPSGA